MGSIKDRNQSVHSFFESLQLEYMMALVRSKIYPSINDRKYYKNRVMTGKRQKIEEICARNNLVSIFDSKDTYNMYYDRVVGEWGFPNFTYRDKETESWQFNQDRINYLAKNTEVAIKSENGEVHIGVIHDNSSILSSHIVVVKKRGENKVLPISVNNVKRIL